MSVRTPGSVLCGLYSIPSVVTQIVRRTGCCPRFATGPIRSDLRLHRRQTRPPILHLLIIRGCPPVCLTGRARKTRLKPPASVDHRSWVQAFVANHFELSLGHGAAGYWISPVGLSGNRYKSWKTGAFVGGRHTKWRENSRKGSDSTRSGSRRMGLCWLGRGGRTPGRAAISPPSSVPGMRLVLARHLTLCIQNGSVNRKRVAS